MKTIITPHRLLLTILRSRSTFILIAFALSAFALAQTAQAVSPPPDGGYTGGNTAEGQNALLSLTTGGFNTAVGFLSLRSDTTGQFNTAIGAGTLFANTADQNTATGAGALLSNATGFGNTANGAFALFSNTTGVVNTANGINALFSNTTGSNNTAYGEEALENSNNDLNTAVGSSALRSNTTGRGNTALGSAAGINVTTADHVICIGINGENVSNSCFIGSIHGVQTANADAIPVLIDSDGQLGTLSSSRRFKKEIKPMDRASEVILSLRPVTFQYKTDAKGTPQFGLIAEEVAKVNPALVLLDKEGKPFTVRYEAVNAMLLNEFLKEHSTVQELKSTVAKQEATIAQQRKDFEANTAQQQKEIQAVTASLKEQASQIQKVSAQIEAIKPAPQVVNNP
jgi:Chaperone of endosialidase